MTVRFRRGVLAVMSSMVASGIALPALAQQPRPDGQPQFRDPRTGQIWTPETVGSGKTTDLSVPADRAFDPKAQTSTVPGTVIQAPSIRVLGSVAITAGPTVPIAVIDDASLSVIPEQRWQVTLYLNNNSAGVINPVIDCHFTNGGTMVENTRASLPPVAGGQRVGLVIYGPASNLFVDRSECRLVSPS
jgi:hypothetical protein